MPTLYVTTPGTRLEREANQLVVVSGSDLLIRVPPVRISGVVLATGVGFTSPALQLLLDHRIDLLISSGSGQVMGRLSSGLDRNVELRHRQHLGVANIASRLTVARAIVSGKIANCRTMVMRWDEGDPNPCTDRAILQLETLAERSLEALTIPALMGIEGAASAAYFAEFARQLREPWTFRTRKRRPPPDPVNCILSVTSTLLNHRCIIALEAAGLDPAIGFLHEMRRGRASLAVDLMEEFRPLIAETVTLSLFNRKMLEPGHFRTKENEVLLTPEGWSKVAAHFEQRMQVLVTVPERATRTTYEKLLEVQARQVRAVIEGRSAGYRPFRMR